MTRGESCAAEPQQIETVPDKLVEDIWRWAKRQAIGQMKLSWGARECWRILEAFPPGKCYPSHYHIAEKLRKSESAARRYLAELKRLGYIEIVIRFDASGSKRAPRGQTSNSYTLLDQPDQSACAKQIVQEWHAKRQKRQE